MISKTKEILSKKQTNKNNEINKWGNLYERYKFILCS